MQVALPTGHGSLEFAERITERLINLSIRVDLVSGRMNDIEEIAGVGGHLAITLLRVAQGDLRALPFDVFVAQFAGAFGDALLKINVGLLEGSVAVLNLLKHFVEALDELADL